MTYSHASSVYHTQNRSVILLASNTGPEWLQSKSDELLRLARAYTQVNDIDARLDLNEQILQFAWNINHKVILSKALKRLKSLENFIQALPKLEIADPEAGVRDGVYVLWDELDLVQKFGRDSVYKSKCKVILSLLSHNITVKKDVEMISIITGHLTDCSLLKAVKAYDDKLGTAIEKLGRYYMSCNSLCRCLSRRRIKAVVDNVTIEIVPPLFKDAEIRKLESCLRNEVSLDLCSYMCSNSSAYIFNDKFAGSDQFPVHAQLNLLMAMINKFHNLKLFTIGTSKFCCFACDLVLEYFKEQQGIKIYRSGTHGKIYGRWADPGLSDACTGYVVKEVDKVWKAMVNDFQLKMNIQSVNTAHDRDAYSGMETEEMIKVARVFAKKKTDIGEFFDTYQE
jgi:hypothetical protein